MHLTRAKRNSSRARRHARRREERDGAVSEQDDKGAPRARPDARRDELLDDALTVVFHDLRGPLHATLGWTSLLRKTAPAELQRGLEVIERNTRMHAWMLDDAAMMVRVAAGLASPRPSDVDLRAVLRELLREHDRALGVSVACDDIEGPALLVRADEELVRHALRAVLSHFSRGGGERRAAAGLRDGEAWVSLTDTARGRMPFGELAAFERGEVEGATFLRDAGLALLVATRVARGHGGAARPVPQGIELAFPCAATSSVGRGDAHATAGDGAAMALTGRRVLVVDDDPHAREVLEAALSMHGAQVRVADSVAAAMRAFRAEAPDAIVSDIGMPEQDGYDLIRQVRAMPAALGGAVPAVALSALSRAADRDRSVRAGFQLHVAKPISVDDVVAAVRSLVGPA